MTHVERGALFQALRALAVYALYLVWMRDHHLDGSLHSPGAEVLVAQSALWLIGLTIAAGLLVQIVVTILSGITRDENLAHLFDERDKQIERRAIESGFGIVGAAFVATLAALANGWTPAVSLNVLVAGFVLADLAVNLLKFRSYLRGF
jgi:hypothetical protein